MCKQPSYDNMIKQYKENNYLEIGYITGIKRIYLR